MRAFVTGDTGFVGSALIRRLPAENHEVVALVRSHAAAESVSALGVSVVEGDLSSTKRFSSAVEGCEVHFVADGRALPFRTFATAYLTTAGVAPPEGNIPGWALRAAGAILESIWKLLRLTSQPPVNRVEAAMESEPQVFKDEKARRELGYEPVITLDEAIAQLVLGVDPSRFLRTCGCTAIPIPTSAVASSWRSC